MGTPKHMSQHRQRRFAEFAERKTREAALARIERLTTVLRRGDERRARVSNAWTRTHYDGDFEVTVPRDGRTALSLVFVQSKDRNTVGDDPAVFGGGATDKHLIYEGLSRVAADAVLAGAGSVHDDAFFSVWHPEIVSLRRALGLPRHPAQIVVSKRGRVNLDALLFDVPDVPVLLIAAPDSMRDRAGWLAARPWVRLMPLIDDRLGDAIDRLREDEGIGRISAIGGRLTASRLVDAGLADDLYLSTTAREGGDPGTPWYAGEKPPVLEVVTRKRWLEHGEQIEFEHLAISGPEAGQRGAA
jgi:riboflavin biosynthesis pyrimidine reductase